MKIVTLSIACKDEDVERIENQMMQSNAAQLGLYTFGVESRETKKWEDKEIIQNLPEEIEI